MKKLLLIFFLLFGLHANEEYNLGEGLQVGSLPFYLGGYISADYKKTEDETRYRVDDIALLAYGNYEKFSYLAELEFKEFYTYIDKNGETSSEKDRHLYTERVYADYTHDENFMFRFGKYNSNVGFWNLLPINVLRETTSSPMSVSILFPKFTTGIDASYTSFSDSELKINTTLQHNGGIEDGYNNYSVDKHYGFGVSYEKDDYVFKFNSGYFHTKDFTDHDLFYALASAKYETNSIQILTEIGSQKDKDQFTTKYAGYIQGLYRFNEHHIGVLRAESYEHTIANQNDNIMIVGYTYRPLYPIAIKTEYQFHKLDDNNQLIFSFSVLF